MRPLDPLGSGEVVGTKSKPQVSSYWQSIAAENEPVYFKKYL